MPYEKPYFCTVCKRNHTKGKIYKEHLQFAEFGEHNDNFVEEIELDDLEVEDLISLEEDLHNDIFFDEEKDQDEFDIEEITEIIKKKEFKINDYITLKLEDGKTNIYVKGERFDQCKYLMLDIPLDESERFDEIESIDEVTNILGWRNSGQRGVKYNIDPDTEFWGHCSNLQAWYEHNYDTRLLHSNLSFPLLKKLSRVGDPLAKQVFKSEIKKRLKTGIPSVINFLTNEGYIDYVTEHGYRRDGIDEVRKLPGVGEATLNKLIKAGFSNLRAIAYSPSIVIQEESGLGQKTTAKLIKASMERLNLDWKRASEVWEERKEMTRLTTGCQELDDLLWGGIEPGTLTELFGEFRTGKTQLCHQLCVNIQLPRTRGGLHGNAYYIDTSNSFRPERIIQMAIGLDLDHTEVLENINVVRAFNSNHQILLVKQLNKVLPDLNVKLLIIDNLITNFLTEYNKIDTHEAFQDSLRSHLMDLQRLLDIYPHLIIVYTNQVKSDEILNGTPLEALGGNVVAHASSTRIFIRKGKGEQRIAKLIHSSHMPEGDAIFSITEDGIRD